MTFLKALGSALYQRVFVHYKPTLLGIGAGAAIVLIDQTTTALQALPQGWAKVLASVAVLAGAFAKQKLSEVAPTSPPAP